VTGKIKMALTTFQTVLLCAALAFVVINVFYIPMHIAGIKDTLENKRRRREARNRLYWSR